MNSHDRLAALRRQETRGCTLVNCDTKFLLSLIDRPDRVELREELGFGQVSVVIATTRHAIDDLYTAMDKKLAIRHLVERAEHQLLDYFKLPTP